MTPRGPAADHAAVRAVLQRALGVSEVSFELTNGGVSTEVYRVEHDGAVLYLRLAEEAGDDFAVEAEVHRRLRAIGVNVPDVTHYEPCAYEVGRSVMLTTAITGDGLHHCRNAAAARRVAADAGRDVALINSISSEGFGWLVRDGVPWPPRGEVATWQGWTFFGIRPDAEVLSDTVFDTVAWDAVQRVVDEEAAQPCPSRLVHGDLDCTPIFQADGVYTGLIDFGELRGAESWYDLAHFKLQDGQIDEMPELFDELLRGYREVSVVDDDVLARIDRTAVLIGVRQLARWMLRFGPRAIDNRWFGKIRSQTSMLLERC